MNTKLLISSAGALLLVMGSWTTAHASPDEEAARTQLKRNDCLKCHALSRDKTGPALQRIAAKYRGDPAAVEKFITHVTTGPAIKLPNGSTENHRIIDTKDLQELTNLAQWVLAQ